MKVLVVLCLLVAMSQALSYSGLLRAEWDAYKAEFHKEYSTPEEDEKRFNIYLKARKMIAEHNAKYARKEVTFEMGLNKFTDMLPDELPLGYVPLDSFEKMGFEKITIPADVEIPDFMDWREKGLVTPVKNQGICNSCWAFSTTGVIEGQQAKKTGKLVSLSEQNLMDCTGQGCKPYNSISALQYVFETGGIDTEESYPYESEFQNDTLTCRYNKENIGAVLKSYNTEKQGDEDYLKQVVATYGPVSVALYASTSFSYYKGGVYYHPEDCEIQTTNHVVLIVGYGVSNFEGDYWIVKNSWGREFGEEGYFRIARNKNSHCHIADYPVVALVE